MYTHNKLKKMPDIRKKYWYQELKEKKEIATMQKERYFW